MDRARFDAFTRLFAARRSRREAIAALLGISALGGAALGETEAKKGKSRGKNHASRDKKRKNRGVRSQAGPPGCFKQGCTLTGGNNKTKCDFGDSSLLKGKNLAGYNLSDINLQNSDASGANFSGVNFAKACLVDANLSGATINGSTNFSQTIRCRTVMPNGSIDNSGCNKGTACCPTCINPGESCAAGLGGACCGFSSCVNDVCVCGPCPEKVCEVATCDFAAGTCSYAGSPDTQPGPGCTDPGKICCGGKCFTGVCCGSADCPSAGAPQCVGLPGGLQCTCFTNGGPCPAGQACCGAAGCKDRRTDPANCGQCGNACPTDGICETATCTNGVCGLVQSPNNGPGPGCANKCCDGVCCGPTQICGGTPRQCCLPTGTATGNPSLCCSLATSGGVCT